MAKKRTTSTPSMGLPFSAVDKIIAKIRNRIYGRVEVEEEWWRISFSRDEFKAFRARFEAEGDYRWPKYDYFPQLAEFVLHEYILGSNGQTQVVIGIDLEYRKNKGKEARLLVRQPRFTEEYGRVVLEAAETETGIFRAVDGSLVNGERILRIGLKDFGLWPDCLGIDDISEEIAISFSQLYEIGFGLQAEWDTFMRGEFLMMQTKTMKVLNGFIGPLMEHWANDAVKQANQDQQGDSTAVLARKQQIRNLINDIEAMNDYLRTMPAWQWPF
ncbi:hypothetical protein P885DRAFT_58287 [Corynascus similis CBS 632.67]